MALRALCPVLAAFALAGVACAGDVATSAFACYADRVAVSPEPFCALRLEPGESFRWTRSYTFHAPGK